MWVLSSFCFVVEGGHGLNSSLGILWQACPGGARILRVFGDSPCPALPVQIEGFPVVEIGPYCFAQNQRSQPADARFWSVDGRGPAAYPHPIAGDFVQGVTLPAGVRALHNAAFYNCRKLEWLCAGSALESVGSDLFTNCRELDRFILDAAPDAPTGLKKLVAAVSADIGAVFAPGGAVQAKVFYPEYFEFLDENTPAHIFNHSIEGEGYRYRQCFDGSVLRFAEYDAAFLQACVGESEKTLCRIALDRLCTPFALLPEAQGIYSAYLAAHAASAAAPLIARRDTESLQLVLKLADEESHRQIALACSQSGWSEGAALTLGGQRPRRQKTYDFDDL